MLSWAPWIVVTPGRTTSSTPSATRQRTAASVTTETGGRVNDHIIEGVLQRLKDLLGRGGRPAALWVRRDGADRQDRDAGVLHPDECGGQCIFLMGGDDIRQARAAARDAQIAETADLRMSQSTSTTRLPEEASVMARLTATLVLPSSGTEEVIRMVLQLPEAERNPDWCAGTYRPR